MSEFGFGFGRQRSYSGPSGGQIQTADYVHAGRSNNRRKMKQVNTICKRTGTTCLNCPEPYCVVYEKKFGVGNE